MIFRRAGTSFRSVDRIYVTLLTALISMSMSAFFHAQDNDNVARVGVVLISALTCSLPAALLRLLFVRTGRMGFFEEWEESRSGRQRFKCFRSFRFPEACRHVWRGATLIAVVGMVAYVLIMSMNFDRQPYYFCRGGAALSWISSWLLSYGVSVLLLEPLQIVLVALVVHYANRRPTKAKSVELMNLETGVAPMPEALQAEEPTDHGRSTDKEPTAESKPEPTVAENKAVSAESQPVTAGDKPQAEVKPEPAGPVEDKPQTETAQAAKLDKAATSTESKAMPEGQIQEQETETQAQPQEQTQAQQAQTQAQPQQAQAQPQQAPQAQPQPQQPQTQEQTQAQPLQVQPQQAQQAQTEAEAPQPKEKGTQTQAEPQEASQTKGEEAQQATEHGLLTDKPKE